MKRTNRNGSAGGDAFKRSRFMRIPKYTAEWYE